MPARRATPAAPRRRTRTTPQPQPVQLPAAQPAATALQPVAGVKWRWIVIDTDNGYNEFGLRETEELAKAAAAEQAQAYIDEENTDPSEIKVFVFPNSYYYNVAPRAVTLEPGR